MGRKPCCDKVGLKKGPWTLEEDKKLVNFITTHGQCCWRTVPELAGLSRCGKSCRLRWTNYLRPDLKRGVFSESEEKLIIDLHSHVGNRWSKIASFLPGRTDNEIKNYWNTHIKKKLKRMGLDPATHRPVSEPLLQNPPPAAENTEAATGLPKTLEDGKPIQEELQVVSVLMKHVKEEESEQPNLPFDAANTQIQSKMEEELQVPEMMNAQTPLLLHAEYWWDYNDFVAGLVDGSEDNTSWVNPESIAGHMFETQGVEVPESSNPHFFLQPVDYFPQETSNKIFPLDF